MARLMSRVVWGGRSSLRKRVAVAMVLAVLVTALGMAFLGSFLVKRTLHAQVAQEEFARVSAAAQQIDDRLQSRLRLLNAAVQGTSLPLAASASGLQRFLDDSPALRSAFDNIAILDDRGVLVANSRPSKAIGTLDLHDRKYFIDTVASRASVISEAIRNRSTGVPQVVLTVPVAAPDGRVRFVMTGAIDLDKNSLFDGVVNLKIGETGYVFILDTNGTVINHPHHSLILKNVNAEGGKNLATEQALAGLEGSAEAMNRYGVYGLYAYKRTKLTNWIVGAIYPAAEAYAPAVALVRASWLLAAGLSAVTAVAALWFLGASLRPLSQLVARMEGLDTAEEFQPVASSFPRNEIGRLAVAYDRLMLRLHDDSERIEKSERMFRAVTDNLPALIAYVDSREHVQVMNATFEEWIGIDVKAAIGQTLENVLGAELYAERRDDLRAALQGQRREFDLVTKAVGGVRHLHSVYLPDVGDDGRVAGLFSISMDVSEFKRVQVELEAQALRDTLTGLPNRRAFDALLASAVEARPQGLPMAVMFIDIDFFKSINDSLGHAAGDAVLKEFARRVSRGVRSTDITARLSGDEFVVLLQGVRSMAEVDRIAANVCRLVAEPMSVGTSMLKVTASIGVVFNDRREVTATALLAAADDALYAAKGAGRDTHRTVELAKPDSSA